jgi:hypothetical protein
MTQSGHAAIFVALNSSPRARHATRYLVAGSQLVRLAKTLAQAQQEHEAGDAKKYHAGTGPFKMPVGQGDARYQKIGRQKRTEKCDVVEGSAKHPAAGAAKPDGPDDVVNGDTEAHGGQLILIPPWPVAVPEIFTPTPSCRTSARRDRGSPKRNRACGTSPPAACIGLDHRGWRHEW